MKKLLTLLLAAGMVVSAANGASAVEMKVSGEWMASFTFADNMYNAYGGKEHPAPLEGSDGSFKAAQRIRINFDMVASESLSGRVQLQVGQGQKFGSGKNAPDYYSWGSNGVAGPGEEVTARLAYLDWIIPSTDVLVRMGILALIVLITWVNGAERRIPVQYAKRQVGRKMYGGQSSTLPMKVNMSGVLPIIFAQSIAMIIPTVAAFLPAPEEGTFGYTLVNAVDSKSVLYMIVYFLMIIAFSYFYATIQFNPVEISNNLKKNGGFIPGFRPGKPTADFIKKVLNKVTLFGAIYLGIVAILPLLIGKIVNVAALSIGGTSVIIVVGVALETVQALESQMLMRQYKGFLE